MTAHAALLVDAISQLTRVQREVGIELARELDCPRAALGLLWLLGKREELTVGDLAHHLRVDISVASRQASALVAAGLVERTRPSRSGTDRRVRIMRLTPAGQEFTARTRERLNGVLAELFAQWSPEDLRAAARHIARVAETMDARATSAEHTAATARCPAEAPVADEPASASRRMNRSTAGSGTPPAPALAGLP